VAGAARTNIHILFSGIAMHYAGADGTWLRMGGPRIASTNVHGSGCTSSSATASYLALGLSLGEAVKAGRECILKAIAAGASVKTGQGQAPLNHSFGSVPLDVLPS
jgi:hydroxymethylpyrimidine/phosphomethylpyrimidine kinase